MLEQSVAKNKNDLNCLLILTVNIVQVCLSLEVIFGKMH